ncbi:YciI family protein [Actinomycetes bacterium KLBMP 9759]
MKYLLLIQHGDAFDWESLSDEEQKKIYAGYGAINNTPGVTPGERLESPENATTVRVQDGKTLTTDGPFVTLKEALGGWLTYEADDLDAAIELAARIPATWHGGSVEIRPFMQG